MVKLSWELWSQRLKMLPNMLCRIMPVEEAQVLDDFNTAHEGFATAGAKVHSPKDAQQNLASSCRTRVSLTSAKNAIITSQTSFHEYSVGRCLAAVSDTKSCRS